MRFLLLSLLMLTSAAFAQSSESIATPLSVSGLTPEVHLALSGVSYTQTADRPGTYAGRLYAHVNGSFPGNNTSIRAEADAFAENIDYTDGQLRLTASKVRSAVKHEGRCGTAITATVDYFYDNVRLVVGGSTTMLPTQPAPNTVINFAGGSVTLNIQTNSGPSANTRDTSLVGLRLVYNGKTVEAGNVSVRTDCQGTPVGLMYFDVE